MPHAKRISKWGEVGLRGTGRPLVGPPRVRFRRSKRQDLERGRYEPDTILVSRFGSIGFYEGESQAEARPCPKCQDILHYLGTGKARRLFTDKEQLKYSNAMPVVSPKGGRIAFVSNRSGEMRVWVSALDGTKAKLVSRPEQGYHKDLNLPFEQKVPAWSPDGKWIALWEGVVMIHMSRFTGKPNPKRDQMIANTFHVWIVGENGGGRRRIGPGDDPTWSPDGFVTRAFPDPSRGGPVVMVGTSNGEKRLPIVPPKRHWGRFCWIP